VTTFVGCYGHCTRQSKVLGVQTRCLVECYDHCTRQRNSLPSATLGKNVSGTTILFVFFAFHPNKQYIYIYIYHQQSNITDILQTIYITVGTFFGRQSLNTNRGGALCTGADGPRPGAGRSATWRRARVSCLTAGRSTRAQGAAKLAGGAWISLLGGTPSGRRDPR
jgi:hypothetical protein